MQLTSQRGYYADADSTSTLMTEERTRVDFNAPKPLIERADSVGEILGISRTRLLIDALEDKLAALADDEEFRQRLNRAYYDGRVDGDTVEAILGREEAMRLKLLRESIDQTLIIPQIEGDLPSDDTFYDGGVSEWKDSSSPNASDGESHS
jgi:hypothetical protein